MKITLISFYFLDSGIRYISSYLKNHGYDNVEIVFFPPDRVLIPSANMYKIEESYPLGALEGLRNVCRDSDVVGISVLTNDYFRAVDVTRYLKSNIKAPIVWGGWHPTASPESCPPEVDYIYVGEGESGMLELVQRLEKKQEIYSMDNIYYWNGIQLHKNKLRPLLRGGDLDHFQDFELENHFVRERDGVVKVLPDIIERNLCRDFEDDVPAYTAVFSRGCPHGCAYCCNNKMDKLYSFEKNMYRSKTVSGMIEELKYVLNKFPFIKFIYMLDDNFLANNISFLKEFAVLYKKDINIPFLALGSPPYITEEKIVVLKDAGLKEVNMGVQSGSDRVNKEIYNRRIPKDSVIRVADLIHKYHLRGRYDFIFDNPYDKIEDEMETARLILKLPKPFIFQPFTLVFFPGTDLYDRAKRDGLIYNERAQIFDRQTTQFYTDNVTYLKLVTLFLPRMPHWFGRILISRPAVLILHRNIFKGFYKQLYLFVYYFKMKFNISVKSLYKKRQDDNHR